MLIIEVSQPRGFRLPPVSSELEEERVGRFLLPGENNVTEQCWNEARKNPCVKIALGAGLLKHKGEGEAVPAPTDFNKMKIDKARGIIRKMDSIDSLNRIKTTANKKVLAICNARIKEIVEESGD